MKQYMDLLKQVFTTGNAKGDRTGTGTRSVFGAQMRFDLKNNQFPLVTTKKMFVRGIVHELIWFMKGLTNNNYLKDVGVKIWNDWALEEEVTREVRLTNVERRILLQEKLEITSLAATKMLDAADHGERVESGNNDGGLKLLDHYGIPDTRTEVVVAQGECGPIYGKQWRKWQAPGGVVIDQIAEVINILKTKPNSRRMVVTAWNPADLPDESISPHENVKLGRQSLASCHCLFQLYTRSLTVQERNQAFEKSGGSFPALTALYADFEAELHTADNGVEVIERLAVLEAKVHEIHDVIGTAKYGLSCHLYQRSCDYFLGVPFNIASYAILTAMIAQVCNMVPDEFIWTGGDVHLYNNHFEQVEEQLTREPLPGPTLWLNPAIKNIDDFTFADIEIRDYQSHATISAPISV